MDYRLENVRSAILVALGVASCGPGVGPAGQEGEGSAESGSESGNASLTAPTDPTDPVDPTDPTGEPLECEGAVEILQSSVEGTFPSGFVKCASGVVHRLEPVTCQNPYRGARNIDCTLEGDGNTCVTDADCTARPFGICNEGGGGGGFSPACFCSYGCESDADCDVDQICACGSDGGELPGRSQCVSTYDCKSGADCGARMCAVGRGDDGCSNWWELGCQSGVDLCATADDCQNGDCMPGADGYWACEDNCCCGRPFFVEGRARTAPLIPGTAWVAPGIHPSTDDLDVAARRTLAQHWQAAAAMEHASVASFARFSLQLMSLGAPPELLSETARAMSDEIDHAQRCFALARAYAGRSVGPGALDVGEIAGELAMIEIVDAVIREACIGETLAAIEAGAALAHATDPAVRTSLRKIADDELRHAQLGWRTLRWALRGATRRQAAEIESRLNAAIAEATLAYAVAEPPPPNAATLRRHGLLDPRTRASVLRQGIADVVSHCCAAVVGPGCYGPAREVGSPRLCGSRDRLHV